MPTSHNRTEKQVFGIDFTSAFDVEADDMRLLLAPGAKSARRRNSDLEFVSTARIILAAERSFDQRDGLPFGSTPAIRSIRRLASCLGEMRPPGRQNAGAQ